MERTLNSQSVSTALLVIVAMGGVWSADISISAKTIMTTGIALTTTRRFLIPEEKILAILLIETVIYILIALFLPGIFAIIMILSLALRFLGLYNPNIARPKTLKHQNISPYIGVSLATTKGLLVISGLDSSLVTYESLSPSLQGLIGLFYSITILSFLLFNRARVYEKLLKDMAVNEKNWTLDLLSLLSHNIRTPITTMSNRIEIMRMKVENDAPINKNDVEALSESTENVSGIVNQLLNNTARTQIRDKEGVISLEDTLNMLHLNGVEIINSEGIDFNLSTTNAIALQLCLESMLSNSKKYGGTTIEIIISSNATDYLLSVKDNGKGMNAKQMKNYGTPFNKSNTSGGTGLGVYFTLQLIKEKGWNWTLDSKEGIGTTATLILPRSKLII